MDDSPEERGDEEEGDTIFKCAEFIVVDKDAKVTLLNSTLFD